MQVTEKELEFLLVSFCRFAGIEFCSAQYEEDKVRTFIEFYKQGSTPAKKN